MAEETLEQAALRKLRASAEHDLAILIGDDPPVDVLPENTWSLEMYRAALRQCLDDIQRSKGTDHD